MRNFSRLPKKIFCLKNNHKTKQCKKIQFACQKCRKPHNTVLHLNEPPSHSKVFTTSQMIESQNKPLLQILKCYLYIEGKEKDSKKYPVNVLLDSGSQVSMIRTKVAKMFELKREKVSASFKTLNGGNKQEHDRNSGV